MGLLKAGIGALSGVLADSWRDYFYCEILDADTLCVKAKREPEVAPLTKKERITSFQMAQLSMSMTDNV